jgi:Zn-dependent protease
MVCERVFVAKRRAVGTRGPSATFTLESASKGHHDMRATFRLGRIAGIPVGVHWSLLVIAALLTTSLAGSVLPSVIPNADGSYWAAAIIAAVLFFASILAHELAHALVAKHYGQKVEDITLWVLGGVSRLGTEAPTPRAEGLVALAGPATSLALGVAFFGGGHLLRAATTTSLLAVVLIWLGVINLILAVFNLLPGSPLDGGRVVSAFLWHRHGDRRRAQIGAARAGRVVGGLLVAYGLVSFAAGFGAGTIWTAFVGWFIWEASRAEEQAARTSRALEGVRARDVMHRAPIEVPEWLTAGDVRRTVRGPTPNEHTVVLRAYDGSVRATVPVDAVRHAPAEVAMRDLAQRAVVVPPDALLLDVLEHSGPLAAIIVVDGAQVLGVIGADELRNVEQRRDQVAAV